ncbi:MAG: hypothetical protein R6V75_09750 [Bacteroidales bacterium]
MDKRIDILKDERLKQQHFPVPEGYFEEFPGRMMQRIHQEGLKPVSRRHKISFHPWMSWASAAAAVLLVAWLGIRTFLPTTDREDLLAQKMQFMVEYYGEDLNEAILAGYLEDQDILLTAGENLEIDDLIYYHPDHAESLVYESIMH